MANVLKMATVADIVTLIKAGHSDRRISAVLSLDRGTVAKYRRKLEQGLTAQQIWQDLIEEHGSWTQLGNVGGHVCFASSSVIHEKHTAKPSTGKRPRSSSKYLRTRSTTSEACPERW